MILRSFAIVSMSKITNDFELTAIKRINRIPNQ